MQAPLIVSQYKRTVVGLRDGEKHGTKLETVRNTALGLRKFSVVTPRSVRGSYRKRGTRVLDFAVVRFLLMMELKFRYP